MFYPHSSKLSVVPPSEAPLVVVGGTVGVVDVVFDGVVDVVFDGVVDVVFDGVVDVASGGVVDVASDVVDVSPDGVLVVESEGFSSPSSFFSACSSSLSFTILACPPLQ